MCFSICFVTSKIFFWNSLGLGLEMTKKPLVPWPFLCLSQLVRQHHATILDSSIHHLRPWRLLRISKKTNDIMTYIMIIITIYADNHNKWYIYQKHISLIHNYITRGCFESSFWESNLHRSTVQPCSTMFNQGIKPLMLYKLYNGPWRLDVWTEKKKRWAGIPRQSLNLSEYVSMILMKHDETDEALMLDETWLDIDAWYWWNMLIMWNMLICLIEVTSTLFLFQE